jgi:uncharacterized protein (DUF1810 family)
MNDPHDLNRFLLAQQDNYECALAEVKNGRKRTHWMWYIFPQIDGLGFSSMARRYGIKSADETRAYLAHPILGSRLLACAEAVVANAGSNATEIFGSPDDLKLRSSATLFASVSAPDSVFTVCWRSSTQAVLTRKRSGCSASATSPLCAGLIRSEQCFERIRRPDASTRTILRISNSWPKTAKHALSHTAKQPYIC